MTEGRADIILTAQTTGAGELAFDFTQRYYTTYLALAERSARILWRLCSSGCLSVSTIDHGHHRRLLLEISEEDWQRAIDRYIPE